MAGYNFLIIICISINSGYKADGFLEEENLSGLVATLQLTVQDLQGQIMALSNKTCGKLTFQYYLIKIKRIIPFRPLKYFRQTLKYFRQTLSYKSMLAFRLRTRRFNYFTLSKYLS